MRYIDAAYCYRCGT